MVDHSKRHAAVKKRSGAPQEAITDPRFSHIQNDPRYRLPSRKDTHVKLDKRFSRMLKDDEFTSKAKVDRYGRRLSSKAGKRRLERQYELEDEKEEELKGDADEEVEKELRRIEEIPYDPARQGGYSESSSSEEEEDSDLEEESVEAEDAGGIGRLEEDGVPTGEVSHRIAVVNLDWDNIRAVDLMAVASSFCPSGGRLLNVTVYPSEFGRERMEREEMEGPPKELFTASKRNATTPADVSASEDADDGDGDGNDDDETIKQQLLQASTSASANTEVDTKALRSYQLSRLRYYYALLTFDTPATAHAVYTEMDGQEYLSTANFFDLRFVPDEVTFDDPVTDKPRDQCDKVPSGYRPNEFVTEALTHSKVSLTWDQEDKSRQEVQKRAFSRKEVDDNDLQAYVGSDSSSDDDANGADEATSTTRTQSAKKDAARAKMRALLGLAPADPTAASARKVKAKAADAAPAGAMQITFSAGLTSTPTASATGSIYANKPSDVESTRESYIRKERERKARRREKAKALRDGLPVPTHNAEEDNVPAPDAQPVDANDEDADADADPFADPFFADPAAANAAARKADKRAKKKAAAAEAEATAARKAKEREELRAVMGSDVGGGGRQGQEGFDMAAIRKREKEEKRRGKDKKRRRDVDYADDDDDDENVKGGKQADFEVDTADPRFKRVFESHEYAIDPTNPRFSGTKGMKKLLETGRSEREKRGDGLASGGKDGRKREGGELDELVQKVKRKKV